MPERGWKVNVSVQFGERATLLLEASEGTIIEQHLREFQGEQWDRIHDVIAVYYERDGIRFVTSRSIKRPERGEVTIPHAAIKSISYVGPSD